MKKRGIQEICSIIENVEGFLSDKEAYFLYEKAFELIPCAVIVEIGSYHGKSSICLAAGL